MINPPPLSFILHPSPPHLTSLSSSPERRLESSALSPGGRSISDIFGKQVWSTFVINCFTLFVINCLTLVTFVIFYIKLVTFVINCLNLVTFVCITGIFRRCRTS